MIECKDCGWESLNYDLTKCRYCKGEMRCPKCSGAGWLWGQELENPDHDTFADTMTQYMCDHESHKWNKNGS